MTLAVPPGHGISLHAKLQHISFGAQNFLLLFSYSPVGLRGALRHLRTKLVIAHAVPAACVMQRTAATTWVQ